MKTRWSLGAVIGLLVLLFSVTSAGAQPPGAPAKPAHTPYTLVSSGVTSFSLVASEYKIFWNSAPPICPPHRPQKPAAPADANGEEISRIASYGSSVRELYHASFCGNPAILSNIVADANYVYFTTSGGLMRP